MRAIRSAGPVPARLEHAEVGSPRSRLSDLWHAPLTDLPVRDEIVRQYVPLSAQMEILEAGPGNGFLAFRLARSVAAITLLEVAEGNVADLRQRFARVPNVRVVHADLCQPASVQDHALSYDAVVAIEVMEYFSDPATALRNLAGVLRPGGSLYAQFPNYECATWPTCYHTRGELEAQLREAGFAAWEICRLQLSSWAQFVYEWLHEKPIRLYRARKRSQRVERPQHYDQTWAGQHARGVERGKSLIHLLWAAIMLLMRLGGRVYRREQCGDTILGKNLFLVATTGEHHGGAV